MLAQLSPIEILRGFYAAEVAYMAAPENSRDTAPMLAFISPTFKLNQSADLPYGGVYHGHAGFSQWSVAMADLYDVVEVQDSQIFENKGSDRIAVVSKLRLRVRSTGQEIIDDPFVQLVRVNLDEGTIAEMWPMYWDVGGKNKALGLQ